MSKEEMADPGHVWYVRRWLAHNSERIAAVIEPPGPGGQSSTGADFVRWLDKLLNQHERVCQKEYDRSGRNYHRYTGD
jgi:hypothetical protein